MDARVCETMLEKAEKGDIVDILSSASLFPGIHGTSQLNVGESFASSFFSRIQSNASLIMDARVCETMLEKAEKGDIVDILSSASLFPGIHGTSQLNVGESFASSFFSRIQSNASLIMDACNKGYPVDSYIDVVLALVLQVSVHSYSKITPEENKSQCFVPLRSFVESFFNSISRFRGNSHIFLMGSVLKEMLYKYHPEGLSVSVNFTPSTPGEREGMKRLSHRVRTVRDCVKSEVAGLTVNKEQQPRINQSFPGVTQEGGVFKFIPERAHVKESRASFSQKEDRYSPMMEI